MENSWLDLKMALIDIGKLTFHAIYFSSHWHENIVICWRIKSFYRLSTKFKQNKDKNCP